MTIGVSTWRLGRSTLPDQERGANRAGRIHGARKLGLVLIEVARRMGGL